MNKEICRLIQTVIFFYLLATAFIVNTIILIKQEIKYFEGFFKFNPRFYLIFHFLLSSSIYIRRKYWNHEFFLTSIFWWMIDLTDLYSFGRLNTIWILLENVCLSLCYANFGVIPKSGVDEQEHPKLSSWIFEQTQELENFELLSKLKN